jgi:hypothetical protein
MSTSPLNTVTVDSPPSATTSSQSVPRMPTVAVGVLMRTTGSRLVVLMTLVKARRPPVIVCLTWAQMRPLTRSSVLPWPSAATARTTSVLCSLTRIWVWSRSSRPVWLPAWVRMVWPAFSRWPTLTGRQASCGLSRTSATPSTKITSASLARAGCQKKAAVPRRHSRSHDTVGRRGGSCMGSPSH